jgi:hypothetical protein
MKGIITGRRTEKTDPTFFTSGVERVLYYTNPPYDVSIIKKKQVQKRETDGRSRCSSGSSSRGVHPL